MQAPYNEVKDIWNEIQEKNYASVLNRIAPNAVILYDGECLDKGRFADKLSSIDCSLYTIENMVVVLYEENVVQSVHDTTIVPQNGMDNDSKCSIMTTWCVNEDVTNIVSLNIVTV